MASFVINNNSFTNILSSNENRLIAIISNPTAIDVELHLGDASTAIAGEGVIVKNDSRFELSALYYKGSISARFTSLLSAAISIVEL